MSQLSRRCAPHCLVRRCARVHRLHQSV